MVLVQKELKNAYIGEYVMPAGIYHNATLGLISLSSDGSSWITIADKNLGATQVYNSGDTLSEAKCGKYYQWGNNYGFAWTGSVSISSSTVNAGSYGPNNYYSGSYFRTVSSGWDSSNNQNLRGYTTGTNEARKGPCDTGYHVATTTERNTIINTGISLGAWVAYDGPGVKTYLKIPFSGYRNYNSSASVKEQGTRAWIWSCEKMDSSTGYAFYAGTGELGSGDQIGTSAGCSIRPFKNEAVQPDDTRTVLYQPS